MSTLHNRRRGATAYLARKPRMCVGLVKPDDWQDGAGVAFRETCPRLAPRNTRCPEHQRGGPERFIEPTRRGGHPQTRRLRDPFTRVIARLKKRNRRRIRTLRKREAAAS